MTISLPRHLGLVGDVHGKLDILGRQAQILVDSGAELVVQLGDFGGVWDGSAAERRRLDRLEEAVRLAGTRLLVVRGNHENEDLVRKIEASADGVKWVTESVGFLPRVWRGEHAQRVVAALGGACSPDFQVRRPGRTWWASEAIAEADLAVLAGGGHADVLLAHDAPMSELLDAEVAKRGPSGFSEVGLQYAREGQEKFTRGFASVTPELVVSGHWHMRMDTGVMPFPDLDGGTFLSRSVILDIEGAPGSMALLDLKTLDLRVVEGDTRPSRAFAREFRELRRQAGLTASEVAALLNVGESTVSAIESGHLAIGEHLLDQLRDA